MKIQKEKSLNNCQNQKLKHTRPIEINCHIPDLVQTFSYVVNSGLHNFLLIVQGRISFVYNQFYKSIGT